MSAAALPRLPPLGLLVPLLGLAALAGWVAFLGDPLWAAVLVGGVAALLVAVSPRVLLITTLLGGLVVTGVVRMYFPALQDLKWGFVLGAWWLGAYGVLYLASHPRGPDGRPTPGVPISALWGLAFLAAATASTLLNWPGVANAVTGLKGYLQMGGLLLALSLLPWPRRLMDRLPLLILAVAWLQLPFAVQQQLVMVPARAALGDGVVAADIVAGTFGGQDSAGGANAVLALFLMIVITGLASAWREGLISGPRALLLGVPLLGPMAVNEAKVTLVYLVLAYLVLFGRDLVHRPLRFLAGCGVMLGVLVLLASAYVINAPRDLDGIPGLIAYIYEGNFGSDYANDGGLTRGAAITYWVDHHGLDDPGALLLGHGAGMTREMPEQVSPRMAHLADPELGIGRLAVTAVLWETGLVGLVCVTGMFWAAYRGAVRLSRRYADDPRRRALFHTLETAVVLFYLSTWHKNFLVFHLGYQALLFLIVGYLGYWGRQGRDPAPASDPDPRPAPTPARPAGPPPTLTWKTPR